VVSLDYEIRNGDSIEIITDKNKTPSVSWLSFVKTTRAKECIKGYINGLNREELLDKGKYILNSYLEKNFGKTLDKDLSLLKYVDGSTLDTKGKEDLLVQLGNLSRKPSSVVRDMFTDKALELGKLKNDHIAKASRVRKRVVSSIVTETPELIIGGEKSIPYHCAKCCEAKYPDKVVGYINRNGVTVHKIGCSSLKRGDFDRFIPAYWEGIRAQEFLVHAEMLFENKIGVLRKLSEILFQMKIDVDAMSASKIEDNLSRIEFTLKFEEEDYYLFDRLIGRIKLAIPEFKSGNLLQRK